MLSEGFMVSTPGCRVPSDSILQKLLSFSQDLVLQAIVHSYIFNVPVDFIPLRKDLLPAFHPMFVSSYCCPPCRCWGCYTYFIFNFASVGSLNVCFYNSSCFSLWPFVWCIPVSCERGKGRLFLSSVELKVRVFFWMRKQKGLTGSSLLSEFLPETGHISAERVVIKLAFLQKIESSKPTLMATIMI